MNACQRGEPPGQKQRHDLFFSEQRWNAGTLFMNQDDAGAKLNVANWPCVSFSETDGNAQGSACQKLDKTSPDSKSFDATEAKLPQTTDKPESSSTELNERAKALFDAIRLDQPELALTFFFPLDAYKQVKDVVNPERDWTYRLVAEYKHDIHRLHRELKRDMGSATFIRLKVPENGPKWVAPGEEYNKIPYYRVFHSQLHYSTQGRDKQIRIKSLISWRGKWFCVHLSAIKKE